jgi:hypothetical protein
MNRDPMSLRVARLASLAGAISIVIYGAVGVVRGWQPWRGADAPPQGDSVFVRYVVRYPQPEILRAGDLNALHDSLEAWRRGAKFVRPQVRSATMEVYR